MFALCQFPGWTPTFADELQKNFTLQQNAFMAKNQAGKDAQVQQSIVTNIKRMTGKPTQQRPVNNGKGMGE